MPAKNLICCPSCQGPLVTTGLHCDACDLSLTGIFPTNEFASLSEEDLHFLRIFILTEGRIREMESALGVSYPTIKSRLAQLKTTLATVTQASSLPPDAASPDTPITTILQNLEAGRITFDQATTQLQNLKGKD